jgi:methionine synthase II (cobalamin-independent)
VESALVDFYDAFMSDRVDRFAISREYAPGLYALLASVREDPEGYGPFIKGQSVGPVTFAAGIHHPDEKSLLYHPEMLEAMVKGIAIKALWQVRELEKTRKVPVLFLDEPYLSGFGSAFSPVERHEVINLLAEVIQYVRERASARIGIHCCGNTDWSMILESGPDIVNFDAYTYMDYFLLYPEELSRFLNNGGCIAWGIVPTHDFTGEETLDGLYEKLGQGLDRIHGWGIPMETLAKQSLLTPACGMGSMEEPAAEKVLDLLSSLSEKCMQSYSI